MSDTAKSKAAKKSGAAPATKPTSKQIDPQQYYQQVEAAVENQGFAPLYLFFGDEPYLLNQAVQYLKVCALHGGAADFNWNSFMAADADVGSIRDEVETLPMMAPRRVVLVREVNDFREDEWETLRPLIENPVDTTVLMLTASKIDRRKKSHLKLLEKAVSVEFKKPYDNQVPGWIQTIAKAHGMTFNDEGLQLFHRLVGSQLIEIEREVQKLRSFIGDRTEIRREDVAQCVSRLRSENVFEFCEILATGDRPSALLQAVNMLDQGQNELGIIALAARHFRILLMVRIGEAQGLAGQKLATHAQVPSYFLGDYVRQARMWSIRKAENVLLILSETEKALKSSPFSSAIWIENMVSKICELHQTSVESKPVPSTLSLLT